MEFRTLVNCCSVGEIYYIPSEGLEIEDATEFFKRGYNKQRLLAVAEHEQITVLKRFGFKSIMATGSGTGGQIMIRKCNMRERIEGFGSKKTASKKSKK